MKRIITFGLASTLVLFASAASAQYYGTGSNSSSSRTSGHFRSNGTYVESYQRTNPNSTRSDNYGARGNYNPYTGRTGTGYGNRW